MDQESNVFRLAKKFPIDHIFFETDESNCPISDIYMKYSVIVGMTVEAVKELVTNNFNSTFI